METGQQIRLAGQGEAGFNGGPYGDLYVVVSVEASDKFEREGTTIFYNLNLNFVQAALGDTVDIPTVHGDVELVIPEGTQTGKKFRLRGKGAPSLRGGAVGDQYVTVNVVTPTGLNDRQKVALIIVSIERWALPLLFLRRIRLNSFQRETITILFRLTIVFIPSAILSVLSIKSTIIRFILSLHRVTPVSGIVLRMLSSARWTNEV